MKTIQITVDALVANLANTSEAKLTDVALKSGDIIYISVEDPFKGVVLQVDRDGQKIWLRGQSIKAITEPQ